MKLEQLIRLTFNLEDSTRVGGEHGPGLLDAWDSLGHVNLMEKLEQTYDVTFDMSEVIAIESVADIKELLKEKSVLNF